MSAIDSKIDDLYQQPLDAFTAARNALAKTLTGADAARVRALPKPTVVPWAVNQLYWRARPVFDRLRKSGEKLRQAQIGALKGRSTDVRAATDAHRKAIADAMAQAIKLAEAAGSQPNPDELTRTLEALSLAPEIDAPGRLTRPLQPAGFEALSGVPVRAQVRRDHPRLMLVDRRRKHDEQVAAAREAAAARRAELEVSRAEAALERASAFETRARLAWDRTKREVEEAQRALARARGGAG